MDQPGRPPAARKAFVAVATTEEEENNFDFVALRNHPKTITILGAVMHMIKGALGAGVLSGHVSYMTAGIVVAGTLNVLLGIYMSICLYLLVTSAQVLYRRTNVHTMTYADVVEAAFSLFPNVKVKRFAMFFRILIDALIVIDLFGACTTYQLMIAKTIKQLVENVHETHIHGLYDNGDITSPTLLSNLSIPSTSYSNSTPLISNNVPKDTQITSNQTVEEPTSPRSEDIDSVSSPTLLSNLSIPPPSYSPLTPLISERISKSLHTALKNKVENPSLQSFEGFPHLRLYIVALLIPVILICWIVHLKWLAPFSLVANAMIVLCMAVAIYYASVFNPTFSDLEIYTSPYKTLEYCGMIVFAMSCAGVVIPVENVMKEPNKFGVALAIAMTIIIAMMVVMSASGYAAFGLDSRSPITINFPMTMFNKILKGFMACMIYVTHAVNFWVPFNCVFYYIKRKLKSRFMMWELFYRTVFVVLISLIGIAFPSIEALMGFLGNFCLSNIAFVFPNIVCLLTVWERPGLGFMKWRLWRAIIFITVGLFLCICGSIVASHALFLVFWENI